MSTGLKVFLILVGIVGVCCLLCCGGFIWLGYSFMPQESNDPAKIDAARDEIATIQLPAGFKPVHLREMNNVLFNMTNVEYENPATHGRLNLTQMDFKMGNMQQQGELEVRRQMDQQKLGTPHLPLDHAKSDTKTLKIKGRDCNFTFTQGADPVTKTKLRRVMGGFQSKHGFAQIDLEMDDSAFKEDQIVKMLTDIK